MSIRQISVLMARVALFVIYFWFGLLKVVGQSPATAMVSELFTKTMPHMMPFMSFGVFIILFGLFEMAIGILFLIPGAERYALITFFLHIIMTALPLFMISSVWTGMFVPTLEGQYIVKNLALIACALTVWSSLPPKLKMQTDATI